MDSEEASVYKESCDSPPRIVLGHLRDRCFLWSVSCRTRREAEVLWFKLRIFLLKRLFFSFIGSSLPSPIPERHTFRGPPDNTFDLTYLVDIHHLSYLYLQCACHFYVPTRPQWLVGPINNVERIRNIGSSILKYAEVNNIVKVFHEGLCGGGNQINTSLILFPRS